MMVKRDTSHWPTPDTLVKFATPSMLLVAVVVQGYQTSATKLAADKAAAAAVTVKETLKITTEATTGALTEIKETGEKTHKLVNSASISLLKSNAMQAHRIAMLTKDENDVLVASEADREYEEQLKKQHEMDVGDTKR